MIGCAKADVELLVQISSSIAIPTEANMLVARVREGDGDEHEKSYRLGESPRDRWPQTLPIVARSGPRRIELAVELQLGRVGMPSIVVGYAEGVSEVPATGSAIIRLVVGPSCVDRDGDGYGSGFDCAQPDCDDARADVPSRIPCGFDPGGAGSDAGAGDSGMLNPARCGAGPACTDDAVCLAGICRPRCDASGACPHAGFVCYEAFEACVCNAPCFEGACAPYGGGDCIDDCCRI